MDETVQENNINNNAKNCSEDKNTDMVSQQQDAAQSTATQTTAASKRPWNLSAIELKIPKSDGTATTVWVTSIVDANGNLVCYGDTENMKLIVELENGINGIFGDLNAIKHFVERSVEQVGKLSR